MFSVSLRGLRCQKGRLFWLIYDAVLFLVLESVDSILEHSCPISFDVDIVLSTVFDFMTLIQFNS